MGLVERVSEQMKAAQKARDAAQLSALRNVRAALLNEMKKDGSETLDDAVATGCCAGSRSSARRASRRSRRSVGRDRAEAERAEKARDRKLPAAARRRGDHAHMGAGGDRRDRRCERARTRSRDGRADESAPRRCGRQLARKLAASCSAPHSHWTARRRRRRSRGLGRSSAASRSLGLAAVPRFVGLSGTRADRCPSRRASECDSRNCCCERPTDVPAGGLRRGIPVPLQLVLMLSTRSASRRCSIGRRTPRPRRSTLSAAAAVSTRRALATAAVALTFRAGYAHCGRRGRCDRGADPRRGAGRDPRRAPGEGGRRGDLRRRARRSPRSLGAGRDPNRARSGSPRRARVALGTKYLVGLRPRWSSRCGAVR